LFHSEAIANGGDSIKFQVEHRLRTAQIVQQFVCKPKPTELVLPPQEKPKPKKPANDPEN
jgi:hypothetical protein